MKKHEISASIASLLEDQCGFAIGACPSGLAMLPPSDEMEVIAGDGMGGVFYLWHVASIDNKVPVVYLSVYGETSRFADSFLDAIRIVVAHPAAWGDLLVSAHKSKDLFHQVLDRCNQNMEEDEIATRDRLVSLLQLDLTNVDADFFRGAHRDPPFVPMLNSEDGPSPGESFGIRPYP